MPLTLSSTLSDIITAFVTLDSNHPIGATNVSVYQERLQVLWTDTSRVILDISAMSVTAPGLRMVPQAFIDVPGGFNPNNPQVDTSGVSGTLTFASFGAMAGCPLATNYATFDTVNSIPVLDFPSGSTNGIFFVSALPQGAAFANGLKVNLIWSSSVITGNVNWGSAFEDTQAAAINTDHWLAQGTATGTASGTANKPVITSITVAPANLGTLAAESAYRLRIQRITGDTLAGVAQLLAVTVEAA
jgi:hypothetical protein